MKIILFLLVILSTLSVNGQNKSKVMITGSNEKNLTCKLTSKELRDRKETVLAELRKKILVKVELENGFQYSFEGTDEMVDQLTLFVKTERQCCDFFDYQIQVKGSADKTDLKITGPQGVKGFIRDELGL